MQFSTFIVATLAAVASAGPTIKRQADCPEIDKIPICGYPCILTAVTAIGCEADDYACMCGKFDDLRSSAAACVVTNCSFGDSLAVVSAAQAVCAACV
ncbi:hypothetical protein C8A00DRAFT_18887 [Chaetomidium leptoderma]|uniref:CFEM domain-containing protein n=1 Tax=Chaetomidium leptoderma TaxID=669021 RepID=A0AAN6ZUI2_9PEZI|nr:hypothetical protein C8A00DRAFT_18887 [Chaetomidium leptoderma]